MPPVELPVEIDGKCYTELHTDGATSDDVFFRDFMVADLNRAAGVRVPYATPGRASTSSITASSTSTPTA